MPDSLSSTHRLNRAVRFPPDALDYALLALEHPGAPFQPDLVGLIYDEAPLDGCALIVRDHPLLRADAPCTVKVGRMDPLAARVVWLKELEPRVFHVGLQFLE